ncbi:MAG: 5-(carboxyamino)imidazole ribonucleotide mutase [Candidatus Shapirobacteria bacterium]|nr:5-(carboxyamino)imidazole ribonucleotide mutase [Candidatus Shapirobacteria bacterium]
MKPLIGIIMGSDSDLPVMQEAAKLLEEFQIDFEISIVSAHRTPDFMYQYAQESEGRGLKVIIAGAGGAAHLPGMTASLTNLPVIGVPVITKTLQGLDSLFSIVQMPPGIPVATVAINNAKNAALLAVKILAISDQTIRQKLSDYQKNLNQSVRDKNNQLQKIGYQQYINDLIPKN